MNSIKRYLATGIAGGALVLGGCVTTGDLAANSYPDKVVYHINDSADATAAMRNVGNHLDVNPQVKIVVVTHSKGVDFLMEGAKDKNGNPYNINVETLTGRGVTFDVCEITLKSRKLERSQFIPEAQFVPSGVAELGKLQGRGGYAYIKP
ncbi:MAG: DsrE family protein [Burkholderiaceae bacterium]|nr:DsrE family protein [Sulfuritalea sp.]MCF8175324.1 DsrE family protein [Burkholderiaceae bacterium]MCF8183921.1 DsrE family protein [Polynucleobacter sp.]